MSEMSVLLASTFIGMLHSLGDGVQNCGQKSSRDGLEEKDEKGEL